MTARRGASTGRVRGTQCSWCGPGWHARALPNPTSNPTTWRARAQAGGAAETSAAEVEALLRHGRALGLRLAGLPRLAAALDAALAWEAAAARALRPGAAPRLHPSLYPVPQGRRPACSRASVAQAGQRAMRGCAAGWPTAGALHQTGAWGRLLGGGRRSACWPPRPEQSD